MSTPAPQAEIDSEFCYRHPDRQSFIHCQRCGRTICPQCQTLAAVGVQCPECVREGRQQLAASRPGLVSRVVGSGSRPVVTYVLMGLCALIFVVQIVTGASLSPSAGLTSAWVLRPDLIATQPWRLLTSAFLHANFIHILFNLYALFIFGPVLERFLGRARYLALYLIGALGGSVGVVAIWQLAVVTHGESAKWLDGLFVPASALGASGAIFALMGALLILRKAIGLQLTQILIVVAINLAFGFFVRGIAWEAHVGGLLFGAAVAGVYLITRRPQQRSAQIVGVAGVAVVAALLLVAFVVSTPYAYG